MKRVILPFFFRLLCVAFCLFFLPRFSVAQTIPVLPLPPRSPTAITGSAFVKQIDKLPLKEREKLIVQEILSGNIPSALREFKQITYIRNNSSVVFYALPDYLAIGSDSNFIRIPMGPLAAQQIADSLGASLPTALLVDEIAKASVGAIEPFPFRPLGNRNEQPVVFEDSNNVINALFRAKGYCLGELISGLKKDVILTSKITDSIRNHHVTIYGWHYPNGERIQPPNNVHINTYVDYSHGIRLIHCVVKINGKEYNIQDVLSNPDKYFFLSDESSPMLQARY